MKLPIVVHPDYEVLGLVGISFNCEYAEEFKIIYKFGW